MSAECLESPGMLLLHLQAGNWFCHLPEAWGGLQEQDCQVQMHLRALLASPLHSSKEKPNCRQSRLMPPCHVKETSLCVWGCCGAFPQCGNDPRKKRWTQGSAGRDYRAASYWHQWTDWKAASCRYLFWPSVTSCAFHGVGSGMSPHHWSVCVQTGPRLAASLPWPALVLGSGASWW